LRETFVNASLIQLSKILRFGPAEAPRFSRDRTKHQKQAACNKKPGVERRVKPPHRGRLHAMLDKFLASIRSEPHCGFITTQSLNRPLEVPEVTRQLGSITI